LAHSIHKFIIKLKLVNKTDGFVKSP
jgi:hypothetical protein